jgi:FdhD protein
MSTNHREVSYTSYRVPDSSVKTTFLPVELETRLSVNGEDWLGFHCSPENLDYLALGFLFTEMIIESQTEIATLTICENKENIDVWLNHPAEKPLSWSRTSGCSGGLSHLNNLNGFLLQTSRNVEISQVLSAKEIFLDHLKKDESLHNGVHSTMLVGGNKIISCFQDIGRHNTIDKIAGDCLANKLEIQDAVLFTSGRISSDMVLKSARMGIPVLVSLHSVSTLALELAKKMKMTLIGHARYPQISILSGIDRLKF